MKKPSGMKKSGMKKPSKKKIQKMVKQTKGKGKLPKRGMRARTNKKRM